MKYQSQHVNPFVGLRPYENTDSLYYFGRDEQCKTLLRKLYQHRFVAVVGSSGSGKSSLIRAGLIPQLEAGFLVQERDHWLVANMKPGEAPLGNLINSLQTALGSNAQNNSVGVACETNPQQEQSNQLSKATPAQQVEAEELCQTIIEQGAIALINYLSSYLQQSDCNLFILVDQFEELFRFATGDDTQDKKHQQTQRKQAKEFVALILNLTEQTQLPIYICLTMRSDFLGDCDAFYGLPEAINTSQFLVPRLTRDQRSEVITNPIHLAAANITPRLEDKLLNENINTRDDLPVLQHALMRTFDNWLNSKDYPDGAIDISHYQQIHTIHKALDSHANEVRNELNKKQKGITKKLFQSLTTIDAGNRRIRRPAHLNEVCNITQASAQDVIEVVNYFREKNHSFLVMSSEKPDDNPVIDISHESLIRQWQKLADWVDEEADSAKTFRRLVESAQLHKINQTTFYRDADLKQALKWQEAQQPSETWAKRYSTDFTLAMPFLEQSKIDAQRQKDKEKADQEKKQLLLEEKAQLEQQKREDAEQHAKQQHKLLKEKTKLEQQKREDAEQHAKQQQKSLKKSRLLSYFMTIFAVLMVAAAAFAWTLSEGSKRAEEMAENARLEANYNLAKAYEQKVKTDFEKGDRDYKDSDQRKSLRYYRKAWLYALEAEKLDMPEGRNALKPASLSQFVSLSAKALMPQKASSPLPLKIGQVQAISYSPNGSVIASGSDNPNSSKSSIKLWDAKTGELKQTLKGHEGYVRALSYSPDGSVLASGSDDQSIKLWWLQTLDLLYKYDPQQVSDAFQFLWEMGLDKDDLEFEHKTRIPSLIDTDGYYYAETELIPLLLMPKPGENKTDQLIQWLQVQCAYKDMQFDEAIICCKDKDSEVTPMCAEN